MQFFLPAHSGEVFSSEDPIRFSLPFSFQALFCDANNIEHAANTKFFDAIEHHFGRTSTTPFEQTCRDLAQTLSRLHDFPRPAEFAEDLMIQDNYNFNLRQFLEQIPAQRWQIANP
jgi:hypothetical protein